MKDHNHGPRLIPIETATYPVQVFENAWHIGSTGGKSWSLAIALPDDAFFVATHGNRETRATVSRDGNCSCQRHRARRSVCNHIAIVRTIHRM